MRKHLLKSILLLPVITVQWAQAETAFTLTGDIAIGAYTHPAGDDLGISGTLDFSFDELSVIDYRYGANLILDYTGSLTGSPVGIESYGIYLGWDEYRLTVSNDIDLSYIPSTSLSLGEGLISQWQGLQPIDGDAGYSGYFSDGLGEGDVALKISADWESMGGSIGIGPTGLAEISGYMVMDFGLTVSLGKSGGFHGLPGTEALGLEYEAGPANFSFSMGQTLDSNIETNAFKFVYEFEAFDVALSHGRDQAGLATGIKSSTAIAVDWFVGSNGVLSLGAGEYDSVADGRGSQFFASYNHQLEAVELIASVGQFDGALGGIQAEVGLRLTL